MLKPHVLSALGYKLEEDGVVTPTVEAEVSASVEVTPEQSEAVEEAVTQIEEVATAGAELEEAVTQQEEVEEAEATLRAIADNLRTYGQLPQQMYDFLQKTGYLDVIAAAQSSAMNRVQYPAVESINPTALNRQVVDGIISGCEAMLEGAGKRISEFIQKIWDKIVELWDRLVVFVMSNEKRIEALGKKVDGLGDKDISGAAYPGRMLSKSKLHAYNSTLVAACPDLDAAARSIKSTFGGLKKTTTDEGAKVKQALEFIAEKFSQQKGSQTEDNHSTLGEAGWKKAKDLGSTSDTYSAVLQCIKNISRVKSISSVAKTIGKEMAAAAQKSLTDATNKMNQQGATMSMEVDDAAKEVSKKYAELSANFQKGCMYVIRSYMAACSAASSAKAEAPAK